MINQLSIPYDTRVALDVNEANRLYRYAQAQAEMAACAGRNAVMAGLRLGMLLTELKAATPHGEWGQLFKEDPNSTHVSNLSFEQRTANRYMRCYKAVKARLTASEAAQMDALMQDRSTPAVLADIVSRATDGAETPRQMMLGLGVIADRKRPLRDRHIGFTDSGNPHGATALAPMDKLANDLAALKPGEEELEHRRHQAEQDAAMLLKKLGTFVDKGYVNLLRIQEREMFGAGLATYARKVDDIDEQRIKSTMDGLTDGSITL